MNIQCYKGTKDNFHPSFFLNNNWYCQVYLITDNHDEDGSIVGVCGDDDYMLIKELKILGFKED